MTHVKKVIIGLAVVGSVLTIGFYRKIAACKLQVTNDSNKVVLLAPVDAEGVDQSTPETVRIEAGKVGEYGKHGQHAEFSIWQQDATGAWKRKRIVKQTACSATKSDVELKVNELIADQPKEELKDMFTFAS